MSKLSAPHSALDLWLKAESACLGGGHASHIQPPTLLGSASSELPGLKNRRRRQEEEQNIITSLTPETHLPLLAVAASPAFTFWPSRQRVRPPCAYKHAGDFSAEP